MTDPTVEHAVPAGAAEATADAPLERPKVSWKQIVIQVGVTGLVLWGVFGIVIPELGASYESVADVLGTVTVPELALILAATVTLWFSQGWIFDSVLPGLGIRRGAFSFLSATAVVNTIPGPWDLFIRFSEYRVWGFSSDQAGISMFVSGVFTIFLKLGLPVLAVALLVVTDDTADSPIGLVAIGLVVLGILVFVLVQTLRSERFATWLGDLLQRITSWALRVARQRPYTRITERVLEIRDQTKHLFLTRSWRAIAANLATAGINVLIVWICLRAVGVGRETLSAVDVLAGYAFVGLITVIPITMGNVGIAEAGWIGMLDSLSDGVATDEITAAVLLSRMFTWFLVIPIGWTMGLVWRHRIKKTIGVDPFDPRTLGALDDDPPTPVMA